MAKTHDLTFYRGIEGWVKIGEMQVEDDGSFKGQFSGSQIPELPQMIAQPGLDVVFAMMIMPAKAQNT